MNDGSLPIRFLQSRSFLRSEKQQWRLGTHTEGAGRNRLEDVHFNQWSQHLIISQGIADLGGTIKIRVVREDGGYEFRNRLGVTVHEPYTYSSTRGPLMKRGVLLPGDSWNPFEDSIPASGKWETLLRAIWSDAESRCRGARERPKLIVRIEPDDTFLERIPFRFFGTVHESQVFLVVIGDGW